MLQCKRVICDVISWFEKNTTYIKVVEKYVMFIYSNTDNFFL